MRRNAAVVFSAFFIFFIFQTNSLKLISNSAQPPTPGLSDDPGQTTCNHCHAGTTRMDATKFTLKLSPDSAGLIGSANVVTASTQYIPDSTQWVSLELNGTNGSTPKYGFQLTALDSLGNLAGTFTLTNTTNTSSQFSGATGRRYVGHKNASMTTTAWSFKWKAPHTGKVIFYYCGNIANGDGVEIHGATLAGQVIQRCPVLGTPADHITLRPHDLVTELGVRFAVAQHLLAGPLRSFFAEQQILRDRVGFRPLHRSRSRLVRREAVLVSFHKSQCRRAFGPRVGLGRGEAGVLGDDGGGHTGKAALNNLV